MKVDKETRFTIRLPENVHKEIEAIATKNRRSINNEMLVIFEKFISEAKKIAAEQAAAEALTEEEQSIYDKFKGLPLSEKQALIDKLSRQN
jgi:predicted transcriptional regulator